MVLLDEAELVHDPLGPGALGCPALVEDERLAHPDELPAAADGPVFPGGLPVAGLRGAVGPVARRVLAVPQAVQVPLLPAHARGVCNTPVCSLDLDRRRRRRRVNRLKSTEVMLSSFIGKFGAAGVEL